jgi:Domain of unknown function (DUF1963)
VSDVIGAWAGAAAAASQRAVAEMEGLVAVKVAATIIHGEPVVVPIAQRYVERTAAHIGVREALERRWRPAIELLPLMDDESRGAWRALCETGADFMQTAEALQRRVAELTWPDDALPLVEARDIAWRLAEKYLGHDRMLRLLGEPAVPEPVVVAPPRSRDELADRLQTFGLPVTLAARASWALALVPGGTGESRLGGRPDMIDAWPLCDGHGLTHLASIALAELPVVEDRAILPADGTLVFFADFSDENAGWGPARGDDPEIRIVYVEPGSATQACAPPDEPRRVGAVPVELHERGVRFEPVLTLPFPESGSDLDAFLELSRSMPSPDHLLLGHPPFIQDDPRDAGELSLLQLNWDEDLGFTYGDGGQVTFYGAADDIRAGRWDRLYAMPDSS